MRIIRYVRGGRDCLHDISYSHEDVFLRFGTDEVSPKSLTAALEDLQNYAQEISGIDELRITKLEFSNPDTLEHGLKIHGKALAGK
jgi:hypothetical protein